MKGLFVFNEATDISFYSVDSQFETHLLRRCDVLGAVRSEEDSDDLRGPLTLFFAPLTTSFNVLNSLKKPLLSITAENNFLIVFKKFGNEVYVAVNGDDSETEEVLERKLHAFHRIIGLLYGPAITRINSSNLQQRAIEWKTLSSFLYSYEKLYKEEQAFLLEAVEHIVFGQLNAAQEVCISLAEDCLNPSLNGGIHNARHALLLVGSKVLAACGRSPQLPTADLLLLILLVTNIYHHCPPEEVAKDTPNEKGESTDHMGDNGTPYQTPVMSPHTEQPPESEHDQPSYKTSDKDHKSFGVRIHQALLGRGKNQASYETLDPSVFEEASFQTALSKFCERKVFLQLYKSHYIPHMVYCLEVYPQIVLVLIAETSSSTLAGAICQALTNLRMVLNMPSSRETLNSKAVYDVLEDSIKRTVDNAKSEAKVLNSDLLKQCVGKVFNTWAKCKEHHILQYIDKQLKEERDQTRLLNQIDNLVDYLINLYEELYFSPRVADYDKKTVVSRLLKLSSKLKLDYGDYLAVKAKINLPFAGFGMDYVGMVHFAFVDRSFDELTSPSILDDSVSPYVVKKANEANQSPGEFMMAKMWAMVQKAQNYISNGYTSVTWMDDDFLYTYCMWISTPNPNPQTPLKMLTPSNIKGEGPPGVLCGNFYKGIKSTSDTSASGYVNELYCIHTPCISIEEATKQCKGLAVSLWMDTKQSLAPFPLIN